MGPDGGQRFGKEWVESSQFPWSPEDDHKSWNQVFDMALMKLCWPAEMFPDHTGVVLALNKVEVHCISASHKDANLWVLVWRKIGEYIDEGIDPCVV